MYVFCCIGFFVSYHSSFIFISYFVPLSWQYCAEMSEERSTTVVSVYSGVALVVKELTYLQAQCLKFHFASLEVSSARSLNVQPSWFCGFFFSSQYRHLLLSKYSSSVFNRFIDPSFWFRYQSQSHLIRLWWKPSTTNFSPSLPLLSPWKHSKSIPTATSIQLAARPMSQSQPLFVIRNPTFGNPLPLISQVLFLSLKSFHVDPCPPNATPHMSVYS